LLLAAMGKLSRSFQNNAGITMNELFGRQVAVLRRLIGDYNAGVIGLNALIQNIEGIGDVLSVKTWNDAVFPIILSMEQINAAAIEEKRKLTASDTVSIEKSLFELEGLIKCLETGLMG